MQDREIDVKEGLKKKNVRRKLFKDDDDGEHPDIENNVENRFYEEERRKLEEAKRRWNFDFEKEKPLPGRYEWVKIDKDGKEVRDSTTEDKSEKRKVEETEEEGEK